MPCLRFASWLLVIGRVDPRFRFVRQHDDINYCVTDSDIDLFADLVVSRVPFVCARVYYYVPGE